MKFHIGMTLAALLAVGGTAQAGTNLTYNAATDGTFVCKGYCVGYVVDNAAHTVDSVFLQRRSGSYYVFNVSVDGKIFTGAGWSVIPSVLMASDGSYIIAATTSYNQQYVCAHSGRVAVCVTNYQVYTGTISIP